MVTFQIELFLPYKKCVEMLLRALNNEYNILVKDRSITVVDVD